MIHDSELDFEVGSDNVFADIGVPNPDEALARARLMSRVVDAIRERRLSNTGAAELLRTDESAVDDLMRGRFHRASLERLTAFAAALGLDPDA